MLCDQCCEHMHREISSLEGKMVNLLAYGCDGGDCDYSLRERLDKYHDMTIQSPIPEHEPSFTDIAKQMRVNADILMMEITNHANFEIERIKKETQEKETT